MHLYPEASSWAPVGEKRRYRVKWPDPTELSLIVLHSRRHQKHHAVKPCLLVSMAMMIFLQSHDVNGAPRRTCYLPKTPENREAFRTIRNKYEDLRFNGVEPWQHCSKMYLQQPKMDNLTIQDKPSHHKESGYLLEFKEGLQKFNTSNTEVLSRSSSGTEYLQPAPGYQSNQPPSPSPPPPSCQLRWTRFGQMLCRPVAPKDPKLLRCIDQNQQQPNHEQKNFFNKCILLRAKIFLLLKGRSPETSSVSSPQPMSLLEVRQPQLPISPASFAVVATLQSWCNLLYEHTRMHVVLSTLPAKEEGPGKDGSYGRGSDNPCVPLGEKSFSLKVGRMLESPLSTFNYTMLSSCWLRVRLATHV
ncbi:hypothetical protein JD844_006037 [Phrynosoma platyrhinos]|uniref:Uncharacterized protein n=1 Tax=Phrynosoma platyrhinos TaxID=52577 RepID=A0ABQ7TQ92_PHRPL|nr:hypothetical protein JD844_006037 [Phrynosoma platyrhinos]